MKKKISQKLKSSSTLARSEDGTIQITFKIPNEIIEETKKTVLKKLSKEVDIPGFRPGQAPLSKVEEKVSKDTLLEKILTYILPDILNEAIKEYKIKPSIYPRIELIKARLGEDWEIRATTCELSQVELGDYKQKIIAALRVQKIWTPDSLKEEKEEKQLSREEKEQLVIKTLLESIKVKVPKILIDEEVNSKLSKFLERLEKLGLSLETYLSSTGKSPQDLRNEYERQAYEGISLDLILTKIAQDENLEVNPKDVETAINFAKSDPKISDDFESEERKKFIEAILKRKKALEYLVNLS